MHEHMKLGDMRARLEMMGVPEYYVCKAGTNEYQNITQGLTYYNTKTGRYQLSNTFLHTLGMKLYLLVTINKVWYTGTYLGNSHYYLLKTPSTDKTHQQPWEAVQTTRVSGLLHITLQVQQVLPSVPKDCEVSLNNLQMSVLSTADNNSSLIESKEKNQSNFIPPKTLFLQGTNTNQMVGNEVAMCALVVKQLFPHVNFICNPQIELISSNDAKSICGLVWA
jgi:hypothetical protein